MKILPTMINGCFLIQPNIMHDERGRVGKVFHEGIFQEHKLVSHFAEEFYTVSHKRVLRGLHFQLPPHDHEKIVYCVQGSIFDVALDIRVGSPTFGKALTMELSAESGQALYFPKGIAHGFYALSEDALMVYKVSASYSPANDTGILWNSAAINWPDQNPIVSERDRGFSSFADFQSPFVYEEVPT